MIYKHNRKIAVHPGEVLEELLAELHITQSTLATHIAVTQSYISDIINGRRNVTGVMAHKLAAAVGFTPDTWMTLQKNWELSQVDPHVAKGIRKIAA